MTRFTGVMLLAALALQWAAPVRALTPDKPFDQYVRDNWSVEQGLPQIAATAITQGPRGYIWVGTQQGLARFDGVRFRVFNISNSRELPGNWVTHLFTDRQGRIWVGTIRGAALLDRSGLHRLEPEDAEGSRVSVEVTGFAQLPDDTILMATDKGLFRFAGGDRFRAADPLGGTPVYALAAVGNTVWAGGANGVTRIANGSARFFALPAGTRSTNVTSLAEFRKGIWMGTRAGLFRMAGERIVQVPTPEGLAHEAIYSLFVDSDDNLWVGADSMLLRIRQGRVVEVVRRNDPGGIPLVLAMFEDQEHNLWVGSRKEGLTRLWNGWIERFSTRNGLDDPATWAITPGPDGQFWVGSNSSLSVFRDGRFRVLATNASYPGTAVLCFLFRPDGGVWFGTDQGLAEYRNGKVRRLPDLDPLLSSKVYTLKQDADGAVWIGATTGIYRYADGRLQAMKTGAGKGPLDVRHVAIDAQGTVYAGGRNGLFAWKKGALEQVRLREGDDPPNIRGLLINQGALRVVAGVDHLFVKVAGKWRGFSEADGLPENTATNLFMDSHGMLWVPGVLGLYKVPFSDFTALATGRITRLNAEMLLSIGGDVFGAQKASCCDGAGDQSGFLRGDNMWLPTPDGIIDVPVTQIVHNTVVPNVRIEQIRYGGIWHQADPGELMHVPAADRDLSFDFTVLSFRDPKSVRIKYQLEGYDPDWQTLEDPLRRTASYTNLPPGEYVFRVRGANNAGVWNRQIAEQRFDIGYRFYETGWFVALVALSLGLVGFGVHRLRVIALKRDRERLEKLVRERTMELDAANERLQEASETDSLTGLKNRRFLYQALPVDLSNLHRSLQRRGNETRAIGFLMIDIDHFKRVNDQHGHGAGDAVLEQFAAHLRDTLRVGDYVVRWGGEEFLAVLRETDVGDAAKVAAKILRRLKSLDFDTGEGDRLTLTCSIGVVEYPLLRGEPEALPWQRYVELADLALYHVKRTGRDGWAAYQAAPGAGKRLTDALARGTSAALVDAGIVELDPGSTARGEP